METLLRSQPLSALAGDPIQPGIGRMLERIIDAAVRPDHPWQGASGANLSESPEAYFVELLLPGVQAADVALTVQDAVLTLQARRRWDAPPNAQPLWRGFGMGELRQRFTLPGDVDAAAVEADLQDGILRLELPKAAHARPQTIPVTGHGYGRIGGAVSDGSVPATGVAETAPG
jgi:HSP20 family protein